jgi:hypothetical protein
LVSGPSICDLNPKTCLLGVGAWGPRMLRQVLFGVVLTLGYRMALWLVAWPVAAAIVLGKLWRRRLQRALRRTKRGCLVVRLFADSNATKRGPA